MSVVTAVRALWLRVQEPRVATVLQWVIYLATLAAGVSALLAPPASIEGTLGATLTTLWAAFLIGGGALGAVATLPGIWWLERAAVLAAVTGLGIYGVVVVTLHVQSPAGNRGPQAAVILIAALFFATRWSRIRRYAYDPEARTRRPE